VVVEKQTDPGGATQSFTFDPGAGLSPPDDFELTDDQTESFDVDPGTYTVVEEGEAGWSLDSIDCDDANSSGSGDTATFEVEAGETVTCTFNNVEQGEGPGGGGGNGDPVGEIELRKELDPADDPGRFDLLIKRGETIIDSEQGAGDGASTGPNAVDPGSHEVSEQAASGTDLADYQKSIRCIDTARGDEVVVDQPADDPSAEVQVDNGDDIVCTITNTREQGATEPGPPNATVIVNKEAIPESTENFSFATSGGLTPSSFELEDDGDEDDELDSTQQFTFAGSDFDAGGESITEQPESGWSPDVTCTGDDDFSSADSGRTANLNVEPGEQIVCDFENTADEGDVGGETREQPERDAEDPIEREGRESDGALPFTGAQLGLILAIGLGLLGSGLVLARRRRTGGLD
jgi:hypothetical protein